MSSSSSEQSIFRDGLERAEEPEEGVVGETEGREAGRGSTLISWLGPDLGSNNAAHPTLDLARFPLPKHSFLSGIGITRWG